MNNYCCHRSPRRHRKGRAMDQYEELHNNQTTWQDYGRRNHGPHSDTSALSTSALTMSPYSTRRDMKIFADHYRDAVGDKSHVSPYHGKTSQQSHNWPSSNGSSLSPGQSPPTQRSTASVVQSELEKTVENTIPYPQMSPGRCSSSQTKAPVWSPRFPERSGQDLRQEYTDPLCPSRSSKTATAHVWDNVACASTQGTLKSKVDETEIVNGTSQPRHLKRHPEGSLIEYYYSLASPATSRRQINQASVGNCMYSPLASRKLTDIHLINHTNSPSLLRRQPLDSFSSTSETSPLASPRSASPGVMSSSPTCTASPVIARRVPSGPSTLPQCMAEIPSMPNRSHLPSHSPSRTPPHVTPQRAASPNVLPSSQGPDSLITNAGTVYSSLHSGDNNPSSSVILRRKVASPRQTPPVGISGPMKNTTARYSPNLSPGVSPSSSPMMGTLSRTPSSIALLEVPQDSGARPKEKAFDQLRSSREHAEIEAAEACEWLRAAGFPQYAQMFEDFQFPIDIHSVAKDHDFLDRDSIQSLFRRLNILNKCASLKIETTAKRTGEESDEDDQCALSRKWKFQRSSRRWSRRLNPLETYNQESKSDSFGSGERKEKEFNESMQIDPTVSTVSSLHNLTREQKLCQISGQDIDYNAVKGNNVKTGSLKMPSQKSRGPAPREAIIEISSPILVEKTTHKEFPTNTHERMKGAKSLLKRLDSLKGKKYSSLKKRPSLNTKDGISISGPIVTSSSNLQEKIELYNCVDLNTAQENEREKQLTSPSVTRRAKSESLSSNKSKRGGMIFNQDQSIEGIIHSSETSDLESPLTTPQQSPTKVTRTRSVVRSCDEDDEVFSSQTFPRLLSNGYIQTGTGSRINTRTGSFNFGSDSCHDNVHVPRASPNKRRRNSDDKGAYNRGSIYDNVPATLHASLDRMPFTDGSLDDLEEQLRREICNLSNLDHCRSSSVPAMSELESSFVSAEDPFRLHRNMSSTSMSSAEIESEKQDILNNINQLLMTDNFNDEHIVFEAKDSTKEKSDSVSQKSYDTWQEEDSEIDMDDISAISAEVEKLLNGINENLNQINQLEESNSVHDNYSGTDDLSVTSPIPSPTHTTPEMEPKKGHVVSDMDGGLSATSSCQDTSEVDTAGSTEDIHGIMQIRERRDSGVGSSLSRSMRRPRIRWHSFSKSHRPSLNSRPFQIHNLSAGQIMVLRKLALLKLTAMMERHSVSNRSWSGWIKVMPRFMRRPKMPDYKDKNVFGVPLHVTLQRTGQPLPQTILFAMRYLRNTAPDAVGIFRKPGVRTRIQQLKKNCEMKPDHADYEGMMAYDVADMLKQYFRELPEPLLTTKLSETFLNIHTSMPKDLRLQALQATIMLMPDENREVLQSLLLFLSDIAQHSDTNQMTAHNLAVCFAPSLFHMSGPRGGTSPQRRRRAQLGKPDQKELSDNIAAHECLALMIREVKKLFVIPEDTMMKCHFSYMELGEPAALNELGRNSGDDNPGYQNYLEECIQGVLKEARDKFKGWVSCPSEEGTELAYKKVGDGHPLRLWKCSAEIEAPPTELLNRLLRDRHSWDEDYAKWRIVEKLDSETEVFQYVRNSMAPHPSRDYCVVRKWKTDLPRGACVLVSTSVEHPDAALIGGIRGTVLASRYLIEPCGAGKSRLTYICRIDSRGRSVEWYNKAFGQMSANMIGRLRDSFKHSSAEGPETKV